MIHRPVGKYRAAVDVAVGDRPKDTRIVGTDAVIAHDKIAVTGNAHGAVIAHIFILRGDVGLGDRLAVDVDHAVANLHSFTRQTNHAFYEGFRAVQRVPEDHHVSALDGFEPVDEFVDEDALLVGEQRRHAGAFHFRGVVG